MNLYSASTRDVNVKIYKTHPEAPNGKDETA